MRRDGRTVLHGGSAEWIQALADCVVVLMIEKKEAVENLESILSVGGVDMVQFGPSDYSMSIGIPGQEDRQQVLDAEKYVIDTAHRLGIPARVELADATGAERYLELGVKHFCIGWDVLTLHLWLTEQGKRMRDLLNGVAAPQTVVADGTPSKRPY